jgi:hypothetical protein
MPDAITARGACVLDHMQPLKRLSGKLKVQNLIVHDVLRLSGMCPRRVWDLRSRLGSPLGREELRRVSGMLGLRWEPLAPRL